MSKKEKKERKRQWRMEQQNKKNTKTIIFLCILTLAIFIFSQTLNLNKDSTTFNSSSETEKNQNIIPITTSEDDLFLKEAEKDCEIYVKERSGDIVWAEVEFRDDSNVTNNEAFVYGYVYSPNIHKQNFCCRIDKNMKLKSIIIE